MRRFCMLLVVALTALPLMGAPVAATPAGSDVTSMCVSTSSQRVRMPTAGVCAEGERTLVMRPSRRRALCLRAEDVRRVDAGECTQLGGVLRRLPSRTTVTLCAGKGRWLALAAKRARCRGDATRIIRNHPPVGLILRVNALTAEVAANSIVGALSVTDVDRGDHTTFSLVAGDGGRDNARFLLDGALLRSKEAIPAGSYEVRVRARDLLGAFIDEELTLVVGIQEKIA